MFTAPCSRDRECNGQNDGEVETTRFAAAVCDIEVGTGDNGFMNCRWARIELKRGTIMKEQSKITGEFDNR